MSNQQIVDYITKNIQNGHSEKSLRKRLREGGWSAASIDDAFRRYRRTHHAPRASAQRRYARRPKRKILKVLAGLLVLGLVAAGVVHYLHTPHTSAGSAKVGQLSGSQKQTFDITTIAGAIGQYAAANNALPTRLTTGTTPNSLVLCGVTCDPTTDQFGPLLSYQAASVKLHPYAAGLAVPDAQTVYMVPGATCRSQTALGGPTAAPRTMVLLYAAGSGTALSQRCLKL